MRAAVLCDKQPGGLPLHARGDEHRPRFGRRLHPRRDVGRLAENFARGVDNDRAALDADAGGKLGRAGSGVPGVEVGERALGRERRAHGAFGVVLLRLRIAEQRHQPVAELLQNVAAETRHRRGGLVEIGADQVAPVLRVQPCRRPVEPTRSQNITVIGRRSAVSIDEEAGARVGGLGAGSATPREAIALSRRLRSPILTPS